MFGKTSRGAQGGILSFGRSKAKVYFDKDIKTNFEDVAGIDEAKEELREIVLASRNELLRWQCWVTTQHHIPSDWRLSCLYSSAAKAKRLS